MKYILLIGVMLAASAASAQTTGAIVYDSASGLVRMVIVPDNDKELDDPAFSPKGSVQVRVPLARMKSYSSADAAYVAELPATVAAQSVSASKALDLGLNPISRKPLAEDPLPKPITRIAP